MASVLPHPPGSHTSAGHLNGQGSLLNRFFYGHRPQLWNGDDPLEGVFKQSFESIKNNIDLGTIIINPMIYDLDEVVVTNVEPMVVKQDTIEYNADSTK